MKTNKSFAKRLKITKSGKILTRKPGQNHFLAKKSRQHKLGAKRWVRFNISKKELKHYLPHS
ncbi:50S ribosomal protein L35 [Patescibacteria group bacterium]|nr:50S ribosomal protein L35 [Patescibacteria group bacterium]